MLKKGRRKDGTKEKKEGGSMAGWRRGKEEEWEKRKKELG